MLFRSMAGEPMRIDAGRLLDREPPPEPVAVTGSGGAEPAHPRLALRQAALDVTRGRLDLLDRSLYPRFNWQTAIFGRGSGTHPDGRPSTGRGLFPDTPNWATGLTVTFVPSDLFKLRANRRQEESRLTVEE